ncbi:MAG: hypothetical protein MUP99_01305 [Pedobacter sp.]|nr:hypothetical protein [Pedobacter sp.]
MTDKNIQQDIDNLKDEVDQELECKIALNNNLEKASSLLLYLSVALGFVSIFSAFWIGSVAVVLAIIACSLLVYKSSIKLIDQMDINFWFSERCAKLVIQVDALFESADAFSTSQEHALAMTKCWNELHSIKVDRKAYRDGSFTASLQRYYDEKYVRSRYSARLKNKYNKHEIKDLGS